MSNDTVLQWMIGLARQAGAVLMRYRGTTLTRTVKTHVNDFATEADVAAEKLILAALQEQFPTDAVVAEESGVQAGTSDSTWIVDPLDGTWNFANGREHFGVMIARARGDQLTHAVIFNPLSDRMSYAQLNHGSYLNGDRVRLKPAITWETLRDILEELPGGEPLERAVALRESLRDRRVLARLGSAAAQGLETLGRRQDFWVSVPPGKVWDHAPVALVLAEAGLAVTNFYGKPYIWHRDVLGFLAASPTIHDNIIAALQSKG